MPNFAKRSKNIEAEAHLKVAGSEYFEEWTPEERRGRKQNAGIRD